MFSFSILLVSSVLAAKRPTTALTELISRTRRAGHEVAVHLDSREDMDATLRGKGPSPAPPPRRRATPSPTPWPTPYPTPWPTPYPTQTPTPYPTPQPTLPTPYPTPHPTEAMARTWVSGAPTPAPTMWHAAPGVKVAEGMEFLLPVRDALERTLNKWTAVMKSGSSEERFMWCQDTYKLVDETMANHSYTDVDPHAWAMTEIKTEVDWLCKNWEATAGMSAADRQAQYQQHLDAMKEVLDMYVEKLQCLPGDVACNQGSVVGMKPNCVCACKAGWIGDACHERSPDWIAIGMHVAGAPEPYADANGVYKRDPTDVNGKPAWRSTSHSSYQVGQWTDGDWCVIKDGSWIFYTTAYKGSKEPPAEWTSGSVRVAVMYDLEAQVVVSGSGSNSDGTYIRDGTFNGFPKWVNQNNADYTFGQWADGDWAVIKRNSWIYYTTLNKYQPSPPAEFTYSLRRKTVTVKVMYAEGTYTNTLLKNSSAQSVQLVPNGTAAKEPNASAALPKAQAAQNATAVPAQNATAAPVRSLLRGETKASSTPTEVASAKATVDEGPLSQRLARLEADSAAPKAEESLSKRLLRVAGEAGLVRPEAPKAAEANASAAPEDRKAEPNATAVAESTTTEDPLSVRMMRAGVPAVVRPIPAAPKSPEPSPSAAAVEQSDDTHEPLSARMVRNGAMALVHHDAPNVSEPNASAAATEPSTDEPLSVRMKRAGAAALGALPAKASDEPLPAPMRAAGAAAVTPAETLLNKSPAETSSEKIAPEAPGASLNSTKVQLYHSPA